LEQPRIPQPAWLGGCDLLSFFELLIFGTTMLMCSRCMQ
jgi:hypothetical protein